MPRHAQFGVGISAAAVPCAMNASFYQSRFDAMAAAEAKLGTEPTQVSVWGESAPISGRLLDIYSCTVSCCI